MAKRTGMDTPINLLDALWYCSGFGCQCVSTYPGTRLYSLIADIEKPAGATLVCLGSRLEFDVPVYQPMHSPDQALDLILSFGIEIL